MATKKQDEQDKDLHIGEDGRPQPHAVETEQGQASGPLQGPTPEPDTIEANEAGIFPAKEIAPPADLRAETPQNQTLPKQLPVNPEDTEGYAESVEPKREK